MSQIKKDKNKATPSKDSTTSKSKLLLALKDEVVRLRRELDEERAEREKISSWLSQTLKPRLAGEISELRSSVESHDQQISAVKQFLRDNRSSLERGDSDTVSREEFDELQKALAIEREARQQLSLWMKLQFGKKLELLDARILSLINQSGGSSTKPVSTKSTISVIPDSVPEWLRMIGYERYIDEFQRFKCNDIQKITKITDEHLIKMGIALKRHRGDLLHEVAALKSKLEDLNDTQDDEPSTTTTTTTSSVLSKTQQREIESLDPFAEESIQEKVQEEFNDSQRKLDEERKRLQEQFEKDKQLWLEQERDRIRQEVEREERNKLARERSILDEKREREREQERIKKAEMERERERKLLEDEKKRLQKLELEKERDKERAQIEEEKRRLQMIEKEKRELEQKRKQLERDRVELEKQQLSLTQKAKEVESSSHTTSSKAPTVDDLDFDTDIVESPRSTSTPTPAPAPTSTTTNITATKTPSVKSTTTKQLVKPDDDGRSLEEYIADVRSDNCSTNWVLFYFDKGTNSVRFGACGDKGHSELVQHFDEQKVQYALLRVMDKNSRIKFVYIQWIGPSAHFMVKSRSGTCKASVMKLMGQYHIEILAESTDDISKKAILTKLQAAVNF